MSGYKNFAVAGAGAIGKPIAEELLRLQKAGTISKVVVLTRAGSDADYSKLSALGAQITPVDYSSTASVKAALSGIDVLISTLSSFGPTGLVSQFTLIDGAKAAGVKLFAPSAFGSDFSNWSRTPLPVFFRQKEETDKKLEELNLPYVVFNTGTVSDYIFIPAAGFDFDDGKVTIWGTGEPDISFTARPDIARFVGYVLTALPREKLENKTFNIEGERTSWNAIIRAYEAKSGKKLSVDRRPISELEAKLKENPDDVYSFLLLAWGTGWGINGKVEDMGGANAEFPEWNPKKVVDVLVA